MEFKQAEILRSRKGMRHLLEEIVGMLNAGGGRILVGVREEKGAAVALDPLRDQDLGALESPLRDMLADAIEPRLRGGECALEWVPALDGFVLELQVQPRDPRPHPPFCLLSGRDRRYLRRIGDRLRPMSYAEIQEGCREGSAEPKEDWFRKVQEEVDSWWQGTEPHYQLAVALGPLDPAMRIALPRNAAELVNQPPPDLVRPNGWSFVTGLGGNAVLKRNRRLLLSGNSENGYRELRADGRGRLAFRTRLEHLQWGGLESVKKSFPRAQGVLYRDALIETTVSALRLAGRLWQERPPESEIKTVVRLEGIRNWFLPPGRPRTITFGHPNAWRPAEQDEIVAGPHRFEAESFLRNPDEAAWTLIADIYAEFDVEEEIIPCFSDPPRRFVPPK
ncbi:MAG: helix-turn-helix domain-containing protein [Planctomycetota bacterium]